MKTKIAGVAMAAMMACGWASGAKANILTAHFSGSYAPDYVNFFSYNYSSTSDFTSSGGQFSGTLTLDTSRFSANGSQGDIQGSVAVSISGFPDDLSGSNPRGMLPSFDVGFNTNGFQFQYLKVLDYYNNPLPSGSVSYYRGATLNVTAYPDRPFKTNIPGYDLSDYTFSGFETTLEYSQHYFYINGFYISELDKDEFYKVSLDSFYFDKGSIVDVTFVPIPASASLFGTALVGLAALGYGMRRQRAA